jgi:hypothetical protein
MGGKIEHNYRVEQWDRATGKNLVERTFAECDHLHVAIAAYDAAVEICPGEKIAMRAGSHVYRQNFPKARA